MKDTNLLPYILPNVFSISNSLSSTQFAITVLPSLKPHFAVREPPQNMLTLLDNLTMLQDKTDKNVFRERRSTVLHSPNDWAIYVCRCSAFGVQRFGIGACYRMYLCTS